MQETIMHMKENAQKIDTNLGSAPNFIDYTICELAQALDNPIQSQPILKEHSKIESYYDSVEEIDSNPYKNEDLNKVIDMTPNKQCLVPNEIEIPLIFMDDETVDNKDEHDDDKEHQLTQACNFNSYSSTTQQTNNLMNCFKSIEFKVASLNIIDQEVYHQKALMLFLDSWFKNEVAN